jgi:hypothetical protein
VTNQVSRFFKSPYYDRDVVQYAEDNKQPAGLLESLSLRSANASSPAFTGPVMVNFPTPRSLKPFLIGYSLDHEVKPAPDPGFISTY